LTDGSHKEVWREVLVRKNECASPSDAVAPDSAEANLQSHLNPTLHVTVLLATVLLMAGWMGNVENEESD
jgi:hypothetical protein